MALHDGFEYLLGCHGDVFIDLKYTTQCLRVSTRLELTMRGRTVEYLTVPREWEHTCQYFRPCSAVDKVLAPGKRWIQESSDVDEADGGHKGLRASEALTLVAKLRHYHVKEIILLTWRLRWA